MTTNDDQTPKDTTEADSSAGVSCAAASGYAAIRAELWAAGHEPLYQVVVAGPAFGLRYRDKENCQRILWALVPIDSEQRTRFASALLAERERLHSSSLHTASDQATASTES